MAGEALERTENLTRREGVAGVVGEVGGWEGRRVGFWGEAARGGRCRCGGVAAAGGGAVARGGAAARESAIVGARGAAAGVDAGLGLVRRWALMKPGRAGLGVSMEVLEEGAVVGEEGAVVGEERALPEEVAVLGREDELVGREIVGVVACSRAALISASRARMVSMVGRVFISLIRSSK